MLRLFNRKIAFQPKTDNLIPHYRYEEKVRTAAKHATLQLKCTLKRTGASFDETGECPGGTSVLLTDIG